MLVHCGAGTSLGPQLGTSRLSGRPAFGLTPSEPRGPSLRPLGSSCPSVNSIHSWVFTITALGAVVLSKELLIYKHTIKVCVNFKWCPGTSQPTATHLKPEDVLEIPEAT